MPESGVPPGVEPIVLGSEEPLPVELGRMEFPLKPEPLRFL